MKIDVKECAKEILGYVGGAENVRSITHCMTRLRFILVDDTKVDMDSVKKVQGVLGCVVAGGQTQVILGKNVVSVFEEVQKLGNFSNTEKDASASDTSDKEGPMTAKKALTAALNYVSSAMTPMVSGLVAGGMLKVALLLITMVNEGFAATQTYTLLSGLANAPFYFMPIFVAYGASLKLHSTPIYAMLCSATLL